MRKLTAPRVIRTVSISYEFDTMCREHNISISEACRTGISLILAEKGLKEYDNDLNIMRRINLINQKLSETSEELNKLKEKYNAQ